MKVWLEYTVPVLALVDTDAKEVLRVVQMDEEISQPVTAFVDEDGPNGREIPFATREILDAADSDWPVWESGF